MRKNFGRCLVALCCLLWATGSAHAAGSIKWAKSFTEAMSEAKQSNKLVMVDFYTDWCGWCKKLDADTYTDKKVIALSEQMVPVKVDAEKEGIQQAKKYEVTGFPTILFLNADGKLEGKVIGYEAAPAFADSMTKYITAHKETPVLEALLKKDPNNSAAAAKLAGIYAGQGQQEKAVAALAIAEKGDPKNTALPAAYNALGDSYQEEQKFDQAIALFRKAAATGKAPRDIAYAHLSIAFCYLEQEKLKEAVPELEATVAVANGPEDLKKQAQDVLKQVKEKLDSDK